MFRLPAIASTDPRRGVILMVVLILLTLFAIVGLSFALYADAEAKSAQINREAEVAKQPDVEPEMLLSFFLGQLVYDQDNVTGVYSAMRGHSFARSMYGYNDTPGSINALAFNGTGRLRNPNPTLGVDDYNLVNYMSFLNSSLLTKDTFIRDPERFGNRPNPLAAYDPVANAGPYFGFNAPYTYPDLNNMYLAAVKADGTVLLPSFHRPWNGPPGMPFGSLDPTNPNWYTLSSANASLKYLVMRPRAADHFLANEVWDPATGSPYNTVTMTHRSDFFPTTEDAGGDVKNMIGAPGGNDSIWMDLGAPVIISPDGRKFKALFAPLIVDLDNRVNLLVHGNIKGAGGTHVSNQGWGPWTVNLGTVMTKPNPITASPEWPQLFTGTTGPTVYGRYGLPPNIVPGPGAGPNYAQLPFIMGGPTSDPRFATGHFYNHFDYDGCDDLGNATAVFTPTGVGTSCFPNYTTAGGGYGDAQLVGSQELANHPSIYNFFAPTGDDRVFALSNMEALLRFGDTGSQNLTSDLLRLCPANFADPRIRNLVTLRSFDIDQPGISPWLWGASAAYTLTPPPSGVPNYPQGAAVPFPPTPPTAATATPPSEFGATDWRSVSAALGRVDLNRPLPPYPAAPASDPAGFMAAQYARTQLAQDIFTVLLKTTMGLDRSAIPAAPAPGSNPSYDAMRWLAQLAVNIVDFIDSDDYMTPFQWNPMTPTEVVLGTELPRVVVNEAYVQWTKQPNAMNPTSISVWVELLNTFNQDTTLSNNGDAALATATNPTGAYQLVVCAPDTTPSYYRRADNVWGTPTAALPGAPANAVYATINGWPATANTVQASMGGAPQPRTYYLVGPNAISGGGPTPDYQTATMTFGVPTAAANQAPQAPTIMLQRLACPDLPMQANPGAPFYNPFVTVDYMQNVDADPANPPSGLVLAANEQTAVMNTPTSAHSDGRIHPYYGYSLYDLPSSSYFGKGLQTPPVVAGQPQTTFKAPNASTTPPQRTAPLDWLVYLDRQLTSPMELLHVSAFKPHELTQQFYVPTSDPTSAVKPFSHRVPWFDEDLAAAGTTHRLYRLFEFLETGSRASGLAPATTTSMTAIPAPGTPGVSAPATVTPAAMFGFTAAGVPWSIQVGTELVIESADATGNLLAQETVIVTAVTTTTFQASFYKGPYPIAPNTTFTIALPATGNRIPGKININTIWDPETFLALCDYQTSNSFLPGDSATIYGQIQSLIRPGDPGPPAIPAGSFSSKDVPFTGFGTGLYPPADLQYPGGASINNTYLRAFTAGSPPRLFETPSGGAGDVASSATTPPWNKYQLLNKISNNITSRSNVFGVWVTVGFFEVLDDTVRPQILGAEVGRSENRNVRHRMFAIVDRTALTMPTALTTLSAPVTSLGLQPVQVAALGNVPPAVSYPWTIQPGSLVVVDSGSPNQEAVTVTAVTGGAAPTITASFRQYHSAGAIVSVSVLPGNPGPQPRFNPRDPLYAPVVPYFSIIN